jgi:hypothetical protein
MRYPIYDIYWAKEMKRKIIRQKRERGWKGKGRERKRLIAVIEELTRSIIAFACCKDMAILFSFE